jgi:pimeloyl-ACP methyl ester carboxylesterase
MSARRVEVNGVTVAYTEMGAGRSVLFLHGNPESRHTWEPVLRELELGYRFIVPDFPGFGDSQPFPPAFQLGPESLAVFWGAFVDVVAKGERVDVVVHDFGGPWLLPWVAAQPERIRSVAVLNSVFHRDFHWHTWARVWQTPVLGELAVYLAPRAALRQTLRRHAPGVELELVDAMFERMHAVMRSTLLRTYRAYANPSVIFEPWEERLLSALDELPALVLWGDQDVYIPVRFAERFGVNPVHFEELGHWLHLQAPALVATHLGKFWRAC